TSTSLPVVVTMANCGGNPIQSPVIAGDVVLCPNTARTATVTTGITYDSYQRYYKYWFLEDDFEAIEGATSDSFTYDWFTYEQAIVKVVVTLDGVTYESNSTQRDSYS